MKNTLFCDTFKRLVNKLSNITYPVYIGCIVVLILIGQHCNYFSDKHLPGFWYLVAGFAFIIGVNIYSLKQGTSYYQDDIIIFKDHVLQTKLDTMKKRMFSNRNWFFVLLAPTVIVPAVIRIIQYPLGLPITIFAYSALYFIIALCIISYLKYVYLIYLTYDLYQSAHSIKDYNIDLPHRTEWLETLADLTNRSSNRFFLVGLSFIVLLHKISFSGQYGVDLNDPITRVMVIYLWLIIAIAIVLMFPVFTLLSYFTIKKLIAELVLESTYTYEKKSLVYKGKGKRERRMLAELKIMLLHQTPFYPKKPLICYAASYTIAVINFIVTVEAFCSLGQKIGISLIPTVFH